ncbi:aromatic acid decarboxylase [Secundilactobacillus oryzae JCM 18671]|uniref:Aromatic acid decarboxylase n=1 Tax=Secundilactobacillus oryzae JCM 18671 TaxID=1291743 RepID=A0A081BGA7_9LACO|nr:aromatic acid decarboxylase [Secundilactobacillus oryzae JCM 18671]
MKIVNFKTTVTQEDYSIEADVTPIGRDVLIIVTGGDHPHIGDVTTMTKDEGPETVRFPSHDGCRHKDDFVSARIAKKIQAVLPDSATITAGIHVDGITKKQIAAAAPMGDELGERIAEWLSQ